MTEQQRLASAVLGMPWEALAVMLPALHAPTPRAAASCLPWLPVLPAVGAPIHSPPACHA